VGVHCLADPHLSRRRHQPPRHRRARGGSQDQDQGLKSTASAGREAASARVTTQPRPRMHDPFAYCEQLVREADKDRFLATLFAPANRRGPLFALYAFNSEVARVRDAIDNPMAGEIRLQWWRDALERPGAGEARANPIAAAMLDTVVRFRLPLAAIA